MNNSETAPLGCQRLVHASRSSSRSAPPRSRRRNSAPGQVKAVNIATQAVTNPKLKNLGGHLVQNQEPRDRRRRPRRQLGRQLEDRQESGDQRQTRQRSRQREQTGEELRDQPEIGPEAVTTGKLANESISSAKFSATLCKQLLKNVTYVTVTSRPTQSETNKTIIALCPTGKEAIGGGVRVNGANTPGRRRPIRPRIQCRRCPHRLERLGPRDRPGGRLLVPAVLRGLRRTLGSRSAPKLCLGGPAQAGPPHVWRRRQGVAGHRRPP